MISQNWGVGESATLHSWTKKTNLGKKFTWLQVFYVLSKLNHYFFLVVGFSPLISTDEIAKILGSGANLPNLVKSQSLCHEDILKRLVSKVIVGCIYVHILFLM